MSEENRLAAIERMKQYSKKEIRVKMRELVNNRWKDPDAGRRQSEIMNKARLLKRLTKIKNA